MKRFETVVYQEMSTLRRAESHRRAWQALRGVTPRDSAQRAALEHHRSQITPDGRGRRVWLAAAAILLALGSGGTLLLAMRSKAPLASPTLVAVLPFTVRGDSQFGYLSEGMVNLLSANLDGLGGLRTADPRGLLAFVSRKAGNPEHGLATANHFGAGLFVLGDIIETNGRLDLAAYLYDERGGLQTTARASAAIEEGIYGAVDEIARQLLVSRRTGPAEEMTRLAAATSSSLPALKAYLEGERLLRDGNFSAAVEAFQSATSADTAFALAYYRLAIAAEWVLLSN